MCLMATIRREELSDHQGCSASICGNCCLLMVLEVMTEFDWRKNFYVYYLVHLVETLIYESFATVGEIRVYRRADFQSGSRVLKKVF